MGRKIIFITSGILFILVSIGLIIAGADSNFKTGVVLSGMAIPFLFIGFWNLYSVVYERKFVARNEYYTFKGSGLFSWGAGAFYNKGVVLPVFIILFGCAAMGIATGFLVWSAEEFAVVLMAVSFAYALTVTIIYLVRLNRTTDAKEEAIQENSDDEFGFKVAFFFASLATLGLFALGYLVYKKLKK